MDVYNKYHSSVISVEEVPLDKVEKYGIINGDKTEDHVYKISELVEKPLIDKAPSNLAIMYRYVLTPDIFDKIDETQPGVGGENQLTDAIQKIDSIYGVAFEGKHIILVIGLNGSRHQLNLNLMMSSWVIWSVR